jgi:hypothetical protein
LLVEHPVLDRNIAGSNPVAPTIVTRERLAENVSSETRYPPEINSGQKNGALKKFEENPHILDGESFLVP